MTSSPGMWFVRAEEPTPIPGIWALLPGSTAPLCAALSVTVFLLSPLTLCLCLSCRAANRLDWWVHLFLLVFLCVCVCVCVCLCLCVCVCVWDVYAKCDLMQKSTIISVSPFSSRVCQAASGLYGGPEVHNQTPHNHFIMTSLQKVTFIVDFVNHWNVL